MFNPAGGLIYHGRAAFHRNGLWKGFRTELGQWLQNWAPKDRKLLLVEPGAGYCLSKDLLSRFDRISVVESDPLAAILFRLRFREQLHGKAGDFDNHNYFATPDRLLDSDETYKMLDHYPGHAILFCNLLGQIQLLHEEEAHSSQFTCWKWNLGAALKKRSWASFHDRLSSELAPLPLSDLQSQETTDGQKTSRIGIGSSKSHLSNAELVELFYRHSSGKTRGGIQDHLTGDFAPWLPRTYFNWEIRPGYHHLVEAIRST